MQAGDVLGDRFELHGVLGRGSTGVVWLATDRLRAAGSGRIALKVLHPHLVSEPSARRRLQRELQASAMLRSDAALVPHDLHELDGTLALSMPYHPGQTLAERVAAKGPLGADEVRALGLRLAAGLAAAHRAGVLHRDVTANNVLIGDDPAGAVLTDFGLARVHGGARSTTVLGTAGYAAPEVFAGSRSDPRSDLYGLGAVLFFALTGKVPAAHEGSVAALAPRCPPDLARLVDDLVRVDPARRPQGAREVSDRLEGKAPVETPPPSVRTGEGAPLRPLPEGAFTVLVRERSEQRGRREYRRRREHRVRPSLEDGLRWGVEVALEKANRHLGTQFPLGDRSPEDALHAGVASLVGARPEDLEPSPALYRREFRLVDATDLATARRLADLARDVGFRARVYEVVDRSEAMSWPWILYVLAQVSGWVVVRWADSPLLLALMLAFTVGFPIVMTRDRAHHERSLSRREADELPVAYRALLTGAVKGGATVAADPSADVRSRGALLEARALAALDALLADVEGATQLADLARRDLRDSIAEQRAQAIALAADVTRMERVLADAADDAQVEQLQARLDRMVALERAGEAVDARARAEVERALARHRSQQEATERLESELTIATARLVQVASLAAEVRRELARRPDRPNTVDADERLKRQVRAMMESERELASARAMER